ncbi:MAG: L-threonylcarbamoyladenylate synthase [Raoultibacter sp.]|jgi:L-threonylcarbamoyladenylate synthase
MSASEEMIERGVAMLRAGRPLIFPTDTVYGLGVAVGLADSPEILYELKKRDFGKPVAWLVDSANALREYGRDIPEYAEILAQSFWPGPLTLIVQASSAVPKSYLAGDSTIALRMPQNKCALELIRRVGLPLATTSANMSGYDAPQHFEDIDAGLLEQVGLALRDDSPKTGSPSTIVDCQQNQPIVLRQGTISESDIRLLG